MNNPNNDNLTEVATSSTSAPALNITHQLKGDLLIIDLSGMLKNPQAVLAQQSLDALLHTNKPKEIIINAEKISHCDSAGLVTLNNFLLACGAENILCNINQLNQKFQKLLHAVNQSTETKPSQPDEKKLNFIEKTGKTIHAHFSLAKQNITFFGEILVYLAQWLRHPFKTPLRKFWYYVEDIGPNSFPLVLLIGILFGMILSFQSLVQLKKFGAEIYVANLVSVSLIRELGPLLMAIVITGRIASAYAAEISAMKVNQEIDALKAMGLDPVPFLVLPRLIAAALVAPLLALLLDLFGLLGCGILMFSEGFATDVIIQQMFSFVKFADIFNSMFKSMIFGFLVTGIGCIQGLNSGRDATSVGQSTTSTVVRCIVAIVVVDGIFSVVFYALG